MFTQGERRREERRVEQFKFRKEVKALSDEMQSCLDRMFDDLEAKIESLAAFHNPALYRAIHNLTRPWGYLVRRENQLKETRKACYEDVRWELKCFEAVRKGDDEAYKALLEGGTA